MEANFKDTVTGKYYHVTGYTIRTTKTGLIYLDGEGRELLGEEQKPLLNLDPGKGNIADDVIVTTVTIGYNKGARDRDIAGIRQIARNHTRSDEGKHESQKNARRELKNK
jgi:hypothetical protein